MGGGSHHRGASHRIGDIWPADARSSLALPFVSYSGPRHQRNSPFRPCWQSHPSSYCASTVSILQPGNFAISVVLLTGMAWISPAQWGARTWAAFLFVCLVCLCPLPHQTHRCRQHLPRHLHRDLTRTRVLSWRSAVDPLKANAIGGTVHLLHDHRPQHDPGAAPGCCLPSEAIAPAVVFLASDDAYIVSADVIVGNIATDNG
jgi:hypothetical protein